VQGVYLGTYPFRTNIVNPHYLAVGAPISEPRHSALARGALLRYDYPPCGEWHHTGDIFIGMGETDD